MVILWFLSECRRKAAEARPARPAPMIVIFSWEDILGAVWNEAGSVSKGLFLGVTDVSGCANDFGHGEARPILSVVVTALGTRSFRDSLHEVVCVCPR